MRHMRSRSGVRSRSGGGVSGCGVGRFRGRARHRSSPVRRSLGIAVGFLVATALVGQACRPAGPGDGDGALIGPEPPPSTASITLAWDPPETDAAGRPLQDLASYRIYFGHGSPLDVARDTFVEVGLVTTYTLRGLPSGTYFFATTALDESGNESELSGEVGVELSAP